MLEQKTAVREALDFFRKDRIASLAPELSEIATDQIAKMTDDFQGFIGSWFGRLILFGYTWALIHHLLSGLRYLVWDLGYCHGPVERERLTRLAAYGAIGLTLLVWIVAYALGGGR